MIVVGVDGCPDGWVAAAADLDDGQLEFRVFARFSDLVEHYEDAGAIGIDVPIGLLTCYSRSADLRARKLMPGKGSSVFPAPHPDIIHEHTHEAASTRSKEVHKKGVSQQGFAILPKIAEVNEFLTQELQRRIFEVHPEVSFTELNGGDPVRSRKSRTAGFDARRELLVKRSGFTSIPTKLEASKVGNGLKVHADDTLDAIVAAWTARRFVEGIAKRIPSEPQIGFRGLRAEIVY
jgi:predicted RNase H-like nuclease